MKNIIFSIITLSTIFSQINLSGDARIRPRLDIIDYGNNKSSMDLYYLYRAHINIDADIGNGWFFNTKLGTNDIAGMVRMGKDGTYNKKIDNDDEINEFIKGYSDGPGNSNSARPQVDFLNLYYGIKKDKFGFWGGAIPLKHNSALDIHFYPDKMVDIPWKNWNNESTTGFAGYIGKFNWFLSIDGDKKEIDKDGETRKNIDPFSFGFDFSVKWNDILQTLRPRGIFSIANLDEPWPMTFGLDINFINIFKIKPVISYYYTSQSINKDYNYNGSHLRFRIDRELGPGKLNFWTDLVSHICDTDIEGEYKKTDYVYLWLDYDYNFFNSDFGSISIKPTIRILTQKTSNSNYSRMKFELTTGIKFK